MGRVAIRNDYWFSETAVFWRDDNSNGRNGINRGKIGRSLEQVWCLLESNDLIRNPPSTQPELSHI